jgi:para-aminobenzoate synthetase component 1
MEIIEELEPHRRTIYTGSLGYLSFSGTMDFNILIRTILKMGRRIYFGVGAGIVADSEPEKEFQETLVKARAMLEALR